MGWPILAWIARGAPVPVGTEAAGMATAPIPLSEIVRVLSPALVDVAIED